MEKENVDEAVLGYIAGLLGGVADDALPQIRVQQVKIADADPSDKAKAEIVAMIDAEIVRRQIGSPKTAKNT